MEVEVWVAQGNTMCSCEAYGNPMEGKARMERRGGLGESVSFPGYQEILEERKAQYLNISKQIHESRPVGLSLKYALRVLSEYHGKVQRKQQTRGEKEQESEHAKMKKKWEECEILVYDHGQIYGSGLLVHAVLEEKVKKLQHKKIQENGRVNEEDVIVGKEGGGEQGRTTGAFREMREDFQNQWETGSSQTDLLPANKVARWILEAAIRVETGRTTSAITSEASSFFKEGMDHCRAQSEDLQMTRWKEREKKDWQ